MRLSSPQRWVVFCWMGTQYVALKGMVFRIMRSWLQSFEACYVVRDAAVSWFASIDAIVIVSYVRYSYYTL
ncbi:hypothetical protein V8C42DRAFT_334189 [Trichoderma barbatum]